MSKEINDFIKSESEAWVTKFIADRIAYLNSKKIRGSGNLSASLSGEVIAGVKAEGVKALVDFDTYGRFIDMKKFDAPKGGGDYIAELEDWIRNKGLAAKFIRGFMKKRNLKKQPERVLTYIAWGIAKKRFNGKYRRRKWYNKSKTAAISELFRDISANMPDLVAQQLKENLKQ